MSSGRNAAFILTSDIDLMYEHWEIKKKKGNDIDILKMPSVHSEWPICVVAVCTIKLNYMLALLATLAA